MIYYNMIMLVHLGKRKYVFTAIFATASSLGFRIVASADVSGKYATDGDGNTIHPLDVHSIYLVKMPPQGKGVFDSLRQTMNDFSLPSYEEAMK